MRYSVTTKSLASEKHSHSYSSKSNLMGTLYIWQENRETVDTVPRINHLNVQKNLSWQYELSWRTLPVSSPINIYVHILEPADDFIMLR